MIDSLSHDPIVATHSSHWPPSKILSGATTHEKSSHLLSFISFQTPFLIPYLITSKIRTWRLKKGALSFFKVKETTSCMFFCCSSFFDYNTDMFIHVFCYLTECEGCGEFVYGDLFVSNKKAVCINCHVPEQRLRLTAQKEDKAKVRNLSYFWYIAIKLVI